MKNIPRKSTALLLSIMLCGCASQGVTIQREESSPSVQITTSASEEAPAEAEDSSEPEEPSEVAYTSEPAPPEESCTVQTTTVSQPTERPQESVEPLQVSDSAIPDGTWVDEHGFVLSAENGLIFSYDSGEPHQPSEGEVELLADGSLRYADTIVYPADSSEGKRCLDALYKAAENEWTMLDYSYIFSNGTMSLAYDGMSEEIAEYEWDGCQIVLTIYEESMSTNVRIENDTMTLIDPMYPSSVLEFYLKGSHAEKEHIAEYIAAYGESPESLIGTWYEQDDISQKWVFTADSVTINDKTYSYSAEGGLYNIALSIDSKEYSAAYNEYSDSLTLSHDGNYIYLLSENSEKYQEMYRSRLVKNECAELLERYPDNDGWMEYCDFGDIPLLADPDYLDKYAAGGYFPISTPEELASACYYLNTQPADYYVIELMNDIDLAGHEWAPMGWTNDHPFDSLISGNGHTIKNLTIDSRDSDVGLIGWATFCGVYDISFTDASVSGSSAVGIVTGQSIGCSYANVSVSGTVTGSQAGSLVGYEANGNMKNCSADVLVNGEKFDFLSWNEKRKSEIVIEDPVTITMDEDYTVHRPEVEGYHNLGWMVLYNGNQVLHRNAENELSYRYFSDDPGEYEIYLTAYVSGQYVPISNTITYTIE